MPSQPNLAPFSDSEKLIEFKFSSTQDYLKSVSQWVEDAMERHLPLNDIQAKELYQAVRYSLFAGGKRFRPALALASWKACGGKGDNIWYATTALESLHTFSLIHDDLPCMDDDDFRRGQPTNHKVYGEGMAVLAGDFLCAFAFEILSRSKNANAISTLARATHKMLLGQVADIQAEGKPADEEKVQFIHSHKTSALIEASVMMGAQLAEAPEDWVSGLGKYGQKIGLAFQVVDDILDLERTTEELGKDAGSDAQRKKATYPAIMGLEHSKTKARDLVAQAKMEIKKLPIKSDVLEMIADFMITRVR